MEKVFRVPRKRLTRGSPQLFIPRLAAGAEIGFAFRLSRRIACLRGISRDSRVTPGKARARGRNALKTYSPTDRVAAMTSGDAR
jgi:hypothetical protein